MENIKSPDIFDSQYYKINKYLLIKFGLWPYLSKKKKYFALVLFSMLCFSLFLPISLGFKRIWGPNIVPIVENIGGLLYLGSIYTKYLSVYIFESKMKLVYEQIQIDWESLTDKDEKNILHKHSMEGRFLTIFFSSYSIIAVMVFNGFPYLPLVLDYAFPLKNETRLRVYPYHPDYLFCDSEKYYYELWTYHGMIVSSTATAAVVAIDGMMMANIKHACGLFEIVCIVKKIQDSFSFSFLFMLGCGVIIIGMLTFDLMASSKEHIKVAVIIAILLGVYIVMFYLNWIVQQVINQSEEVFKYTYFSDWYNLSNPARKWIFMIMRKSITPCSISAGYICDMNLQTFVAIVKTAMSYATIMWQMQNS